MLKNVCFGSSQLRTDLEHKLARKRGPSGARDEGQVCAHIRKGFWGSLGLQPPVLGVGEQGRRLHPHSPKFLLPSPSRQLHGRLAFG